MSTAEKAKKSESPTREGPSKPPASRLQALAAAANIVGVAETVAKELTQVPAQESPEKPQGRRERPRRARRAAAPTTGETKRTFRWDGAGDQALKRLAFRWNAERKSDEPELTVDQLGQIMRDFFLRQCDPLAIIAEALRPRPSANA